MSNPVLEIKDLVKHYSVKGRFRGRKKFVHALDGVSLSLAKTKTVSLVGESGCGKSTLAKCAMLLEPPTSGRICLDGNDITAPGVKVARKTRQMVQMVFQDPHASLNPRKKVLQSISAALRLKNMTDPLARRRKTAELIELVGLGQEFLERYPHELSGGQCQRVAIARAFAMDPKVFIFDEPVSALDVSIQAQVINLIKRLQKRFGLSYLFISHDLALVQHISDRVFVMYMGQIVEVADVHAIRSERLHPYSQALFSAAPVVDFDSNTRKKRILLSGDVPSPIDPPTGCRFHTRCPYKEEICISEVPSLRDIDGRWVACHFAGEV
jgi:oligopeptide/dipeptide ABC transporter ATP-binding protein